MQEACRTMEIPLCEIKVGGVPFLFLRLGRRPGLWLGIATAVAILLISRWFVWSVDVTGNERMTVSEVLSELEECGFGVGSYIPKVRMGELETRVLIASDKISWISVHMEGTVAKVQIIEHVPAREIKTKPANLVAAADGQIELIELYRGNCVVKIGQAVRRGELLAGGVYDSQAVGVRFTRAAGRVLARTEHRFSVEIPLRQEKKVYSDKKIDGIELNFFGKTVKIFKNSRNAGGECDIIRREFGHASIGGRTLLIGISVTYRVEYVTETVAVPPEEAERQAYLSLETRLTSLSEDAELLQKEISVVVTESACILDCRLLCIEDIAVQTEFEILEEP
jgi:similar to stage IV sporulation protein